MLTLLCWLTPISSRRASASMNWKKTERCIRSWTESDSRWNHCSTTSKEPKWNSVARCSWCTWPSMPAFNKVRSVESPLAKWCSTSSANTSPAAKRPQPQPRLPRRVERLASNVCHGFRNLFDDESLGEAVTSTMIRCYAACPPIKSLAV